MQVKSKHLIVRKKILEKKCKKKMLVGWILFFLHLFFLHLFSYNKMLTFYLHIFKEAFFDNIITNSSTKYDGENFFLNLTYHTRVLSCMQMMINIIAEY